ncbi:Hypothetical protein NTJ_04066 [Nesidiocoris tenuis]|uniref:Uncharacterized protein n=1 Tax=Nesidiocoris tenuis TaxID=355587 RepID=A0ABN7AG66_9HEMI|nr:Hypothetical protein NTJ_04066 [Nesidiocoris tenuis]
MGISDSLGGLVRLRIKGKAGVSDGTSFTDHNQERWPVVSSHLLPTPTLPPKLILYLSALSVFRPLFELTT